MIRYNLQFFAKDGPGGEKTEPATAKKLKEARDKGQVAKSQDLSGSVILLAFFIVLKVYVGTMGTQFLEQFNSSYIKIGELSGTDIELGEIGAYMRNITNDAMRDMLVIMLPILIVGFGLGILVNVVQVGMKPSPEAMKPKGDKFNPINGFKRVFSVRTLVQFVKQLLIIAVCVLVTYNRLKNKIGIILNLYDVSLTAAIVNMGELILDLGVTISIVYLIVGIADFIFEKLKFREDMKMTKQEIKDEWKDTEGSPEVKSSQKRRMQEASRRRMMAAVPEADVVITNPTHFAVALKYEPNSGKAPIVVAKGEDYVALKIKEKAREAEVEIVENKPLARMLYYNVELGMEIPSELYQAVAEVLAFVWKLKNKL